MKRSSTRSSTSHDAWNDLRGWEVTHHFDGWLVGRRPWHRSSGAGGDEPLTRHADWRGPFKIARGRDERGGKGTEAPEMLEVRFECWLPIALERDLDADATEPRAALLHRISALAASFDPAASPAVTNDGAAPEPPAAEELQGWLAACGRTATIDGDGNLRLTLKRRGADGQVLVDRGGGRSVRLTLPLGAWKRVSPPARRAMLGLTEWTNATTRLARVAWQDGEEGCRCHAVADLTGLLASGDAVVESFSRGMLELSVAGLELCMRRLGVELDTLAAEEGRELVALLLAGQAQLTGSTPDMYEHVSE